MNTFIVIAALMAAVAGAIVAVPLLRAKGSRVLGIVAAALLTGAAAGLLIGANVHQPAQPACIRYGRIGIGIPWRM